MLCSFRLSFLTSLALLVTGCVAPQGGSLDPARGAPSSIELTHDHNEEMRTEQLRLALRRASLVSQFDANERMRQATLAANQQARTQQMNEARQSRQTANSTNPAYSQARSAAAITSGATAGFIDFGDALVDFMESAFAAQQVDDFARERGLVLSTVAEGTDTSTLDNRFDSEFIKVAEALGEPGSPFGASVRLSLANDTFPDDNNLLFHTHPVGDFITFLTGVPGVPLLVVPTSFDNPRHSDPDLDFFLGSEETGMSIVLAQTGEYTVLAKPAGWTGPRPRTQSPFGFALDAVDARSSELRDQMFLELTGLATVEDFVRARSLAVQEDAQFQEFLMANDQNDAFVFEAAILAEIEAAINAGDVDAAIAASSRLTELSQAFSDALMRAGTTEIDLIAEGLTAVGECGGVRGHRVASDAGLDAGLCQRAGTPAVCGDGGGATAPLRRVALGAGTSCFSCDHG